MDDLLKVAVAGTSRVNGRLKSAATPIERAVAQLDSHGDERRLLLAAGAYALRRRAGVLPLAPGNASDVAADDTWDVTPERIALFIGELLSGRTADVLPEALERLHHARLLLPPALLPTALDAGARSKSLRPALLGVIGQRGRWLARSNKDWSWATTPGDEELASSADTIWQEGKQAERLDVLRLVRSSDPAHARAMIESTWKSERATFRAEAIDILAANLSPDDQPFVETALEDRAQSVRERAEALLSRIPGSRPAREAVTRAEPLIGKRLGFQIVIRPPDGGGVSSDVERATAMIQALSRVPPSHWVGHLGKQPDDLIKAVVRDRDWGFSVLEGWTQATLTYSDAKWAAVLLPIWFIAPPPDLGMAANAYAGSFEATVSQHLSRLLRVMQPSDAERAVASAMSGSFDPVRLAAVLPCLLRPWSAAFTDRYLRTFRDHSERALKQAQGNWPTISVWTTSMQTAALAIPAVCIPGAVRVLTELIDTNRHQGADYLWEHWRRMLLPYIETLRMRQRIIEEIPG